MKEKLCIQSNEVFLVGYLFVKWKTLSMCLELNFCHNELTDNVYGQVYLQKYCLMLPEWESIADVLRVKYHLQKLQQIVSGKITF